MNLIEDITARGGFAPTHELYRAGHTQYGLRAAVRAGLIIRVRQGWYCLPSMPAPATEAMRVGGYATCLTAARAHGLAVRDTPRLHVAVHVGASRLRTRHDKSRRLSAYPDADVLTHWTDSHPDPYRTIADVRTALVAMATCLSPEWVVAAVDSAIRAGLLTPADWSADIRHLPARLRALLVRVDATSESIIESLMRFRLSALGIDARTQVRIRGVGRVDLLIGDRLVIELDGWRFHHERDDFEEDRRRDAALAVAGYRVLRFTYRQLTGSWSRVRAAVEACIRRGDHLAR
jgi:very-short-patch-repair endonuclease